MVLDEMSEDPQSYYNCYVTSTSCYGKSHSGSKLETEKNRQDQRSWLQDPVKKWLAQLV